ncbi:hypothetical protein QWM81_03410 [Streptomyces ficellus]|uniref:Uncharacterized protein n=1 Tax=Streptomyces ficellus TaxID=1977088 RepID=A0ABT7Z0U5_9ACTN|nr:hypothetical protein [Streptomyces ficellus]MDN3293109.1 hypothetical protein [Streptomyces ficellus]
MTASLSRLTNWLRALCAVRRGHHRADGARPAPPPQAPPVTVRRPAATVRHWYEPLDGTATALVRPYLRAYEQEHAWRCAAWVEVAV